ncbi:hypothetical protein ACFQ6N_11175 [Kitasatospora sp. NPDC056446]|uniref:hypothetical protein n=1 Tax=Kitasatospora sp. NPDC056446 TaxID=3345819 RepID=UPI0036CF4D9C
MPRFAARVSAAVALAAVLALATAAPAYADPPVPAVTDLVGAGAPATDALFNQFSADYNASLAAAGDTTSPRLYSWDARGGGTITPKTGAISILRPANSNTAALALVNNSSATVDFVRLNRPPRFTDPTTLDFVAFAKDAVSWAAPAGGNAPASLSGAVLRSIYACDITNWRQVDPSLPDATIRPVVPGWFASDPGNRWSSFSSDETVSLGNAVTGGLGTFYAGPCVTSGVGDNQGSEDILHDPNAIVPYSVGRWVGQVTGGHRKPGDDPGVLVPHGIDGVPSVANGTLNPSFMSTPYSRILYTGLRDAEWRGTDAHSQALRNVFGNRGWLCTSPVAAADLQSYGFLRLSSFACGTTTHS